MSTFKSPKFSLLAPGLVLALFTILFWGHHLGRPLEAETPVQFLRADGDQYLKIAFHLAHNGIYSMSAPASSNPEPTAYRLPGYPFFLALWMKLDPLVRQEKSMDPLGQDMLPAFFRLIHAQVFLFFLTTLCCSLIVRVITHSKIAALVSLFVIGFDRVLWDWSRHVTPEVLLCFLVAAFSLALVLSVIRRGLVWYLLAGVFLAGLCLTRGYFQYFIPFGLTLLIVNAWRTGETRHRAVLNLCVFALVPLLAVQAWKARNYVQLDRWYLTDRGGVILDIRAGLDMVSWRQYQASFFYYSRLPALSRFLEKHFDPADYRCFNRDEDNPASIYQKAKGRRRELIEQSGKMRLADKAQLSEALQKIRAHPFKHLLMCFPLAMRGLGGIIPCVVGLGALVLMAAFSVSRRRLDVGALLLPIFFSFGFCTLFTHNLARYNLPIIPLVYVCVVLSGWFLFRGMRQIVRRN
jgi:4-amino-4-deoxy-L-arabinose transferase-like glycosyltransferase